MWHLFWHDRRAGLLLGEWRQFVERHRARFAGGLFGRSANAQMIRVALPFHLRNLARVEDEVQLEIAGPITIVKILDALEAKYPVLQGTIRDHDTLKRRPFVRFFACKEDLS